METETDQCIKKRVDPRAGFSLVEVLIVLIIITILGGVVTVSLMDHPGEARITATRSQIVELETALQIYKAQQGRFPTQNQGLEALVIAPRSAPLPKDYPEHGYLNARTVPMDAWENPFIYLIPGRQNEAYEIISYGADAQPGGEEEDRDISSAKK